MNYIGLDLSLTGTGIVVLDSTGVVITQDLIKTNSKQEMEERFDNIIDQIDTIIENYKDKIIYMEGLSFGSSGQSMLELAGLHYIVRHAFWRYKYNFTVIPPSKIKKFITGKGNCKKELMLLYVFKKFGVTIEENNIADAYCLAQLNLHDNWIPKVKEK
jgi:crossover junction endodeoxyribonuclease RuvC